MQKNDYKSYKDLKIWIRGVELCTQIYKVTQKFPKKETYSLTDQIRRCSVSYPSNIAEGYSRKSTNDYIRFLRIAHGSLAELETQIIISKKQKYIDENIYKNISDEILELMKMTNGLIKKLLYTSH